jgi:hypothetical protein
VRQLETDAAVDDRHTASSLVAHLLTACGREKMSADAARRSNELLAMLWLTTQAFSLLLFASHQRDSNPSATIAHRRRA